MILARAPRVGGGERRGDGSRRWECPEVCPGDDQTNPPETGGEDNPTNGGGRCVAAPSRDGGNRLVR